MFGRTRIQADNVFQLLGGFGIAAQLEGSYPMRLQAVGAPDRRTLASLTGRTRHRARGPVRGIRRLVVSVISTTFFTS